MAQRTHHIRSGLALLVVALAQVPGGTALAAHLQPDAVVDSSGGDLASTSYRSISVVAQPIPAGSCSGANNINRSGFLHRPAAAGYLLPDYTITLSFAGKGSGTVTSLPAGIQCNTACSGVFNAYFPVRLSAVAAPYMVFTGWEGGCTGLDDCILSLKGDVSVTATFADKAHSVYIPGATPGSDYFTTLQAAYNAAPNDGAVWAWDAVYTENLDCAVAKDVTIRGGYDEAYATQAGVTILEGTLTVTNGSITVDRLTVQ